MLTRGEHITGAGGRKPQANEMPNLLSPLGGAIVYPFAQAGQYLALYKNWLFRCVEFRAAKVAACSYIASKTDTTRGQTEKRAMDSNEWIPAIYESPNPEESLIEIIKDTIRWLDMTGDAYIYTPAREFDSKLPVGMWVLPSWAMTIRPGKPGSGKFIDKYIYTYSGALKEIEPDEVIHFRHSVPSLNPWQNYFYGRSLAASIIAKIQVDESADRYLASHFDNFALPSGVVEFPGELDGQAYEVFKTRWLNDFQGAKNAGKFGVITGGGHVVPVTSGHREVEIQEVIKENASIMTQAFGVPLNLLTGDNANYATAVINRRVFESDVVATLAQYVAARMTSHWRKWEVGVRVDAVLPRQSFSDFDPAMLAILAQYNFVTSDDVRPDLGLPPFEQDGATRFVPMSMIPVEIAATGAGLKTDQAGGAEASTEPKTPAAAQKAFTRNGQSRNGHAAADAETNIESLKQRAWNLYQRISHANSE